jgi:hypothetical protein
VVKCSELLYAVAIAFAEYENEAQPQAVLRTVMLAFFLKSCPWVMVVCADDNAEEKRMECSGLNRCETLQSYCLR